MKLKDIKTDVDLAIFSDEKDKEIKLLNEELKKAESTCNLLDKENLKLIDENEKLSIKIKELEEMLNPYKNKIQKLKNENSNLGIDKVKASYEEEIKKMKKELEEVKAKITLQARTREISDKQVQEIKELRALGLSYRAIEEKTKWSKFTIGKALKGDYDN